MHLTPDLSTGEKLGLVAIIAALAAVMLWISLSTARKSRDVHWGTHPGPRMTAFGGWCVFGSSCFFFLACLLAIFFRAPVFVHGATFVLCLLCFAGIEIAFHHDVRAERKAAQATARPAPQPPPPDPYETLVRRTAAGEIAPLVFREPRGAWGRLLGDIPLVGALARTRAAARKQLRLRRRLGVGDRPARPLLADFRARCVRTDPRGEAGGLGALLPDDALPVVVALLDAGGTLSFETLLCDLENERSPIPESLLARAKTVGDLLSALGRHRRTHMEEQGEQ